jgi:spore cortex formation protein SpoVR/YcgB (stage V sporulation)
MFTYKTYHDKNRDKIVEITSTKQEDVAEGIVSKIYNYRAPLIYIEKSSNDGLELVHESSNIGTLDAQHTEKIMAYLHEIFGGVINLETKDDDGEVINLTYDEDGFSHREINFDGKRPL